MDMGGTGGDEGRGKKKKNFLSFYLDFDPIFRIDYRRIEKPGVGGYKAGVIK